MIKIAAQLYTLRDFLKTPEEIGKTLRKVKEIGYDAVQLSGLGPIDPVHLGKLLEENGLEVCATHTNLSRLKDDLGKVIEEHRLWKCSHVAVPALPPEYINPEGYARFAKEASAIGELLNKEGITLSYHNHSFELQSYNGRTGLDIIYGESDPDYLKGEIDTYWIQHGGASPEKWIRRLKGRLPLVHLKDMGIKDFNKQIMMEVGEGNLDWEGILKACKESGTEWYIVEQDVCERDPFESLKISLENMKRMAAKYLQD